MVVSTARPASTEAPAAVGVQVFLGASVTRLEVSGEVDLCSTAVFEGALTDALSSGAASVVVDLDRCGFFDACGYRALAEAADVAVSRGGSVVVEGAPPSLRIIAGIADEPGIVLQERGGDQRS